MHNSTDKQGKKRKASNTPVAVITAIALLIIVIPIVWLSIYASQSFDIYSINTYTDIPGITDTEINAIERLKSERTHFTYAQTLETEAFILPDGTSAGFAVEFCRLLSYLFDIEFVFEHQQRDALLEGIDSMQIDFTGDLNFTAEMWQRYYMTQPIAERSQRIFTLAGNDSIKTQSDAAGLTIGFLADTEDALRIAEFYPELGIRFVAVENISAAAGMIRSGEIDAFTSAGVLEPYFAPYDFLRSQEFFPLMYTPVSMATANPELEPIIKAVDRYLAAGGSSVVYSIYVHSGIEYTRYKLAQLFTEEERAYLDALAAYDRSVGIAMQADNYPICYYDRADRQFKGIAVDILAQISTLTGIEFYFEGSADTGWPELQGMLRTGEVPMISALLHSQGREGEFLWSDAPYATADYALVSKREFPTLAAFQVAEVRVGTVSNTVFEEMYSKWFPGSANLTTYDNQIEALRALESGAVDLLMGSDHLLLMQQSYNGKPDYKVNIRFDTPADSYFGFNNNELILSSIVSKTLENINVGQIEDSWTSRGYDYASNASRQTVAMVILIIAVILAVALIFALLFNRRLQSLVYKIEGHAVVDEAPYEEPVIDDEPLHVEIYEEELFEQAAPDEPLELQPEQIEEPLEPEQMPTEPSSEPEPAHEKPPPETLREHDLPPELMPLEPLPDDLG